MKLHINKLILWPKTVTAEPRVLEFSTKKVNVITGWSSKGKSAVIAIIDYCLGSGSCTIPIGPIRDAVAWYGLDLDTSEGPMRVARRAPGSLAVSNDYWIVRGEAATVSLPSSVNQNSNVLDLKRLMDQAAGLSDLRLVVDGGAGWNERASFRDMAAFNFLPQHIVANPHTLFFKTDSSVHRERLRNVLPVALGIKNNGDLLNEHRAELLRSELRDCEGQLNRQQTAANAWISTATTTHVQAQALGLLPTMEPPTDIASIVRDLRRVVQDGANFQADAGSLTTTAVGRLADVQAREQDLDRDVADARRRLRKLRLLAQSFVGYSEVLSEQRAMTHGVGWFARRVTRDASCPVCGSASEIAVQSIRRLESPLRELQDISAAAKQERPILDRELVSTEKLLLEKERALLDLRRARRQMEGTVRAKGGQRLEDVYRFIGGVEQALAAMGAAENGDLSKRAAELRVQLQLVASKIDRKKRQAAEQLARETVSRVMLEYAAFFGLETPAGPPTLDIRELNVRFSAQSEDDVEAYLWQIGSGENWLGYHLAAFLALHEYFLTLPQQPAPSFLVIDQPSQVFFPSDTFESIGTGGESVERRERIDHDLQRTRRIFETIAFGFRRLATNVQIIVLDHADKTTWGHIEEFHQVADWRENDDALVPKNWL